MVQINEVVLFEVVKGIATIRVDSKPVNALSRPVRLGIQAALENALEAPDVRAIILTCGGRTFFAGAEITDLGDPEAIKELLLVLSTLDESSKPVVAAMHGTALGGGLEVALACHYQIALSTTKLGLPEVELGLLPGAGGTQRLPRLIGAKAALDIIVGGRPVNAAQALDLGLIDRVANSDSLDSEARIFLEEILAANPPLPRVRDKSNKTIEDRENPDLFKTYRNQSSSRLQRLAPRHIIRCIEAAVELSFEEGMKVEAALFKELLNSSESAALRYLFFAERRAAKIPDVPSSTPTRTISTAGVVGAGTMGTGIAMALLNSGIPVTIVENEAESLQRGKEIIAANYATTVAKKRLSQSAYNERMANLSLSLELDALSNADIIIEAIYENIDAKCAMFSRLDQIVGTDAILATNTSFLDVNHIAAQTKHPSRVLGLHFFSPAHVMRLLEIVRGESTAPDVIATAMQLGRKLGKLAVLSGVCEGFIANRMMMRRTRAANSLLLVGVAPERVDQVMTDFGFPMGPFSMLDLVGLDVLKFDEPGQAPSIISQLVDAGRKGQKSGAGFYDYSSDRTPSASPFVTELLAQFGGQSTEMDDETILAQLLYPVVDEGARLLSEGVALRASDIDIALVTGYGWPAETGGPLFWADMVGVPRIIDCLEKLAVAEGTNGPSQFLRDLAESGGKLHHFANDDR